MTKPKGENAFDVRRRVLDGMISSIRTHVEALPGNDDPKMTTAALLLLAGRLHAEHGLDAEQGCDLFAAGYSQGVDERGKAAVNDDQEKDESPDARE